MFLFVAIGFTTQGDFGVFGHMWHSWCGGVTKGPFSLIRKIFKHKRVV